MAEEKPTSSWVLFLRLEDPDGAVVQWETPFFGKTEHDLGMLGAAKGYLEGLYEAAQKALGAQQQQALIGMARELVERVSPPLPRFPFTTGEEGFLDLTVRDVEITRLEELVRLSQQRLDELRLGGKVGRA